MPWQNVLVGTKATKFVYSKESICDSAAAVNRAYGIPLNHATMIVVMHSYRIGPGRNE